MKKLFQAIGLLLIAVTALVVMDYTSHPFSVNKAVQGIQKPALPNLPGIASTDNQKVSGPPTISAEAVNAVLCTFSSPACGKGQTLYNLGKQYNIDPVYALAFFQHESRFGTVGEARKTLSLGNLRCINDRPCVDQDRGGYALFYSWDDGFQHWFSLIRNVYINQWHRETVSAILEKYAPAGDSNDTNAYAQSVLRAVALWRSGKIVA